jgi:hypothetical protein
MLCTAKKNINLTNALPCSQFAMNLSRLELPTLSMRTCLPMCTVAGTCQHMRLDVCELKISVAGFS